MSIVTNQPVIQQRVHRFSSATSDALTSIVLRLCSTATSLAQSVPPAEPLADGLSSSWLDEALRELEASDISLVQWLSRYRRGSSLIHCLLEDPVWRDTNCSASERLWQSLNLAVRCQTLEKQFGEELANRKQEAIYQFAYGLSHELNNPLANIATRAGVLLQSEAAKDRQQLLETIIDNSMCGCEMLGDLMLIARPPKLHFELVQIAPWLAAFVERASLWSARRAVELHATHNCKLACFSFDPVAMSEAIWCLVRNAIEASNVGDVVELTITETDDQLEFSVRDTGAGMSADALLHCFDPYYSGREAGRGLGLGLTKARMIAVLHQSQLRIANCSPHGCEARLLLRKGLSD